MARGRMILRKTGLNDALVKLADMAGPWAVICHHRLLAFQDRNGNTRVDGSFLKSNLFPLQKRLSAATLEGFARSMEAVGLIRTYGYNGLLYANFPTFADCQVNLNYNKEKDECPPFPGIIQEKVGKKSGKEPEKGRTQSEVEVEVEVEGEVEEEKSSAPPRHDKRGGLLDFFRRWNEEICPDFPELRKVTALSSQREAALQHRMFPTDGIPALSIETLVEKLRASPYMPDRPNRRGDWCCFDWIIGVPLRVGGKERPMNWLKLYEGKYAERSRTRDEFADWGKPSDGK